LSDGIGRKPMRPGAATISFAGALPLFLPMYHPKPGLVLLAQCGFVPWPSTCSSARSRR
jgi:hypothetical protein